MAKDEGQPMTYLDDGHYRCDNPDCDLGQGPGTPGFFTGGGNVQNPETGEFEFKEGVCPTCKEKGVKAKPGEGVEE